MDKYIEIGESILKNYFNFYIKEGLDEADYISAIKIIIDGICNSMALNNYNESEITEVNNSLIEFNRNDYVDAWLKQTKEQEGEENIDIQEQKEDAVDYFDYIYEHGEHPD